MQVVRFARRQEARDNRSSSAAIAAADKKLV
jgi:hypothetical protein